MKNNLIHISLFLIVAVLLVGVVSFAGSLTPPGSPSKTMKSLSDLYELINTGSNTPANNFTTPGTVSSTMNTIGDIYDLMTTKIAAIDSTKILTGTSIFGVDGSAVAGTPVPTFAAADQTTYTCESLTTDPAQPAVTLQNICEYNTGCSWTGSACTGGTKTPSGGFFTWYAGKASCANSTAEGQSVGTWRLPTYPELVAHYLEYNNAGNPPDDLQSDYYWSGSTPPTDTSSAYYVHVSIGGLGLANYSYKSGADSLIHCVR